MESSAGVPLYDLHESVRRRVKALKKLQIESIDIEAKFYERVHQLEKEFAPQFDALQAKRKMIVTGEKEPTDAEADAALIHGIPDEEVLREASATTVKGDAPKGIPNFWLNVLKGSPQVGTLIQSHDEPILKHLMDITVSISTDPDSYTLTFHFEPNEYFEQTELTKFYTLQMTPREDDPFVYEGPTVYEAKGSKIEWKKDKNVTLKALKKKSRDGRYVTKIIKTESFFNFFDPPVVKASGQDINEDEENKLAADFEIGQLIRDRIIPRAVLFYTGEASLDDYDYYDEMEDEDEEDVSSDDVDDSEDIRS
ncbi:hypothetical protein AB6A40_006467 [Gnathostoma spinigerum]|uniref:Nucleosome assembly protein n=1 Tax=Gnathostoma spinigerum TaxID=75299 RepID=A0ABD6EIP0_9BILA